MLTADQCASNLPTTTLDEEAGPTSTTSNTTHGQKVSHISSLVSCCIRAPLKVLLSRARPTATAHQGPVDVAVQVEQVDSCARDSTVDNTSSTNAEDAKQVSLVHLNLHQSYKADLKCL